MTRDTSLINGGKVSPRVTKFEDALERLSKIVEKLEKGDLSLDEAIKVFEEGVKLCQFCAKKLDEAEQKVAVLLKNQKGEFYTEPFAEEKNIENEF